MEKTGASQMGGAPSSTSTKSVDDLVKSLREMGTDSRDAQNPNVMIRCVTEFLQRWTEPKLADKVFSLLSYLLEKLRSSNVVIEISTLQQCFSCAMSKSIFWNEKQLEMLKLTMIRLDRLSSAPQEQVAIDNYQALPPNVGMPQIMLNKSTPGPVLDSRSSPIIPPSLMTPSATVAIGSQSSMPMSILSSPSPQYKEPEKRKKQKITNKGTAEDESMKGSYLEKFYHQVELFNGNIASVQQRIQNMEYRLDTFEQQLINSLQTLKDELHQTTGNREKRKRAEDNNADNTEIEKREEENISEKKNT